MQNSIAESVVSAVAGWSGGVAWFWLMLFSFSLFLMVFRRPSSIYRSVTIALGATVLARFSPLLEPVAGFMSIALSALLLTASRYLLTRAADRSVDRSVPGWWPVFTIIAAILASLPLTVVWLVPELSADIAAAITSLILGFHFIIAVLVYGAATRSKAPNGAFMLVLATIPASLAWTAQGVLTLMPLPENFIPEWAGTIAPLVLPAADSLFGLALLLSAMVELSRPAPEETAIDDHAQGVNTSINRFIPGEFLHHLKKDDFFQLKLGDHVRKDMTIFFSDIRAFTELSEQLTPEESFAFINSYLSRVVPIIRANGGFIDKYMGDGIMALFSDDGGADEAVRSAVEIQGKMTEYNGHRANVGYRPISMGIGIHTGPLMLGVVGVSDRMEGTVISDAVNLSSRLQSIAKAFNIPLVISERTFMQLQDPGKYKYRFIGKVRVKGKDAPVSVFEIFDGLPEQLFEKKMRSNTFFEQGMMAYYQKDYSQGIFYFKRALEFVPDDGASRFYLETCLRKAIMPKGMEHG